MPIYEYLCSTCNERHEIIQRISDAPLTHCPKCGGEMRKLISSPAIQFKGSGFYKTDYASAPAGAPQHKSASSSDPAPAGEAKSDSKSETKSETKSEAKT
jgi:putative FmdB family regulatory protein